MPSPRRCGHPCSRIACFDAPACPNRIYVCPCAQTRGWVSAHLPRDGRYACLPPHRGASQLTADASVHTLLDGLSSALARLAAQYRNGPYAAGLLRPEHRPEYVLDRGVWERPVPSTIRKKVGWLRSGGA